MTIREITLRIGEQLEGWNQTPPEEGNADFATLQHESGAYISFYLIEHGSNAGKLEIRPSTQIRATRKSLISYLPSDMQTRFEKSIRVSASRDILDIARDIQSRLITPYLALYRMAQEELAKIEERDAEAQRITERLLNLLPPEALGATVKVGQNLKVSLNFQILTEYQATELITFARRLTEAEH